MRVQTSLAFFAALSLTGSLAFAKAPTAQNTTAHHSAAAQTKSETQKQTSSASKEDVNEKVAALEAQLAALTQNKDNPKPANYDWFKWIRVSGLLNVDYNHQTKPDFNKSHSDTLSIATAKLNIDAPVGDWFAGHMGLFYSNRTQYYYAAASQADNHGVDMDEAYIKISNFAKTPFYFIAGQQYEPFGRYHRYPIVKSLTQQLSEMREVSATLGFIDDSGFYGSAYTFNGEPKVGYDNRNRLNNFGAEVGYTNLISRVRYDLSVDYLNSMADVGAIKNNLPTDYYNTRVPAWALNGDLKAGPFDLLFRYVSAIRRFSKTDFSYQENASGETVGAKPRAGSIEAGYYFKAWDKESNIHAGYEWSDQAYNVNGNSTALKLPKNRFQVGYGIELMKHAMVLIDLRRDHDYKNQNGGTDANDYVGTVRLTLVM